MQQFLLALLLVLGGLSYYLWNENGVLKENNAKLEIAIQTQEEALATLQSDFALQTTQLNEMTVKSQQAQRELNRYNEFIRNYELSDKIMNDPVEMQRKINNGTKHIMEDIEGLSVIVDDLDDGLQLQSNSD
jgi:microsomal dipeptidase-like Zn-dependent dipeptidase